MKGEEKNVLVEERFQVGNNLCFGERNELKTESRGEIVRGFSYGLPREFKIEVQKVNSEESYL